MKFPPGRLVVFFAMLAGGCSHSVELNPFAGGAKGPPSSPDEFVDEVTGMPGRHLGELISAFGPVTDVQVSDDSTTIVLSTHNRQYWFQVTYPGPLPPVKKGERVHFLGRVSGAAKLIRGWRDNVITVDAVAVMAADAAKPNYLRGQRDLAMAWLNGDLNEMEAAAPPPEPR